MKPLICPDTTGRLSEDSAATAAMPSMVARLNNCRPSSVSNWKQRRISEGRESVRISSVVSLRREESVPSAHP